MMLQRSVLIVLLSLSVATACGVAFAQDQESAAEDPAPALSESQRAQRRAILESQRWREVNRRLNEWLSVQTIYTQDEVAGLQADLNARVARMSAPELEKFLNEMEERLKVLTSPEAEDARQWLAQLIAVARDPEQRIGRRRPDVMNMTADEIREELNWLYQHRLNRQRAQAAFERTRAQRVQSARQVHEAQSQAQQRSRDFRGQAAASRFRSELAPPVHERPNLTVDIVDQGPLRPYYTVGPWGHPIRWHPLRDDYWYW